MGLSLTDEDLRAGYKISIFDLAWTGNDPVHCGWSGE